MSSTPSLLLLPALDPISSPSSFRSAYKSTFESLLSKVLPRDKSSTSRLDIVLVPSPSYPVITTDTSRSELFAPIQSLLKQTYSLVCSVAATQKTDLDFPSGIDARIFVVEARTDQLPHNILGKQILSGPVVDVETFVLSDRSYTTIYSVEGETGESQLKHFLTTWGSKHKHEPPNVVRLPCGPAIVHSQQQSQQKPSSTTTGPTHTSVAVGGTFDHLHIGHKLLLTGTILACQPSSQPRTITVGITGDALLVNKKFGAHVESWTTRQERTAEFVDSVLAFYPRKSSPNTNDDSSSTHGLRTTEYIDKEGPNGKIVRVTYHASQSTSNSAEGPGDIVINYTQISDPFGPTITDPDISAIVISAETRAGGKAVNDKRKEKGWNELEVFEVGILDPTETLDDADPTPSAASFESKISSTEIRRRLQQTKQ